MPRQAIERDGKSRRKSFFGKEFARIFDLVMQEVPYESWAAYILDIAKHYGLKPLTVLDLGCGTGTLITHLAAEGIQCVGVDQSRYMISQCRQKCEHSRPQPKFFCQKSWSLKLPYRNFDIIFSFFDTINYITDLRLLQKTFQNVANLVSKGGVFVFDVATELAYQNHLVDQAKQIHSQNIHYKWSSLYSQETKICTIELLFEIGNKQESKFSEIHFQRAYSTKEIIDSLSACGLRVFDIYKAFSFKSQMTNPDEQERLTFIVAKAGHCIEPKE